MTVDVVLTPAEIDHLPERDLSGTSCVVFDVLRATSSMITALAFGAEKIHPVRTVEEALALKEQWPDAILGGERHGDRIPGFDIGNSPLEYREGVAARIITTTTNGTIALRACEHAREVLVGALLNLDALAHTVRSASDLLLVCAGTFRDPALEDILAAGMLCVRLPGSELTDAALTAVALFQQHQPDISAALEVGRNGRALLAKKRQEEIQWCAQVSRFHLVGTLTRGVVVPLPPS